MNGGTQLEVVLYPGTGRATALNYATATGTWDIHKARGFILKHLDRIPPRASNHLLQDAATTVRSACFSLSVKVVLSERCL